MTKPEASYLANPHISDDASEDLALGGFSTVCAADTQSGKLQAALHSDSELKMLGSNPPAPAALQGHSAVEGSSYLQVSCSVDLQICCLQFS